MYLYFLIFLQVHVSGIFLLMHVWTLIIDQTDNKNCQILEEASCVLSLDLDNIIIIWKLNIYIYYWRVVFLCFLQIIVNCKILNFF